MKWILLFILIPSLLKAQTAHIEGDKILYKDTISVAGTSKTILYNRAVKAIAKNVHPVKKDRGDNNRTEDRIMATGNIKLTADYPTTKTLYYLITLKVKDGAYSYLIDSFDIKQAKSGGKTKSILNEEVLKDMEKSGKPSEEAEKVLNEIDMDIQKLIALIKRDMGKG